MTTTYIQHLKQVIPNDKGQLIEWSKQFVSELDNGEINGLEAKKMLVMMQKLIDNVKDSIDELALTEAEKYGQKQFEALGMKHEIREVGARYDFSNCGDVEYNQVLITKKDNESKLKAREAFLKAITKPTELHIGDGKVIIVNPPIKYSKTAVVSTII